MTTIDSLVRVLHMLFAGAWAGGTILLVGAVLPAASRGTFSSDGLEWILRRFSYLSMAAVAALLITGGHLAGTFYTVESLQSTGRGHLVLTMTGLWLVLAGMLHLGTRRLTATMETAGVEAAVDSTRSWFWLAGGVALLLLIVAGLL